MRRLAIAIACMFLAVAGATAQGAPGEAIAYDVDLQGVEDSGLKDDIREASRLVSLKDRPPPGIIALRRRANEDRQRIADVLRSRGYYDGSVDIALDEEAKPVKATITVRQGEVYTFAGWRVEPDLGIHPADVGIVLGRPAVAAQVVAAEGQLLQRLAVRAHPLAKVEERHVVVDHATRTMTVTERVDPGPLCRMADPVVNGLKGIAPAWVQNRITWRAGDLFDPAKIEDLRKSLSDSGLFQTIRISSGHALDAQGLLPVTVDLVERPSRSVGAGVVYSTGEGPGAQAFWENRNLLGEADRLRLTGLASRQRDLALADYRNPDYFGRDKDLVGDLSYEQINTEAFYSRVEQVSGGISWRVSKTWTLSGALALENDNDHPSGESAQSFQLVSLPMTARLDTTDSLLDPTRGGVTTLRLRPYVELNDGHREFTRLELNQTQHLALLDDPRVILALWGDIGGYLDAKAIDLPIDKRFFAGGGGSVRGYRLRYAGPLNSQGQPTGGRSLFGLGSELRIKVTDDIGLVPFFEGANVYDTTLPDVTQRLFYGAGLGFRYYTALGPLRLDFAMPLRRRQGVDDLYQIYVSIGQAF